MTGHAEKSLFVIAEWAEKQLETKNMFLSKWLNKERPQYQKYQSNPVAHCCFVWFVCINLLSFKCLNGLKWKSIKLRSGIAINSREKILKVRLKRGILQFELNWHCFFELNWWVNFNKYFANINLSSSWVVRPRRLFCEKQKLTY